MPIPSAYQIQARSNRLPIPFRRGDFISPAESYNPARREFQPKPYYSSSIYCHKDKKAPILMIQSAQAGIYRWELGSNEYTLDCQ